MKTRAPSPDAYCNLGLLHCRIGSFADAEKCFQQALHLNADCVQGYIGLTMLREQEGKTAAAINLYQNVVRLTRGRPDAADAYRQLGLLYVKLGNMEDAVKSLQEAVRVGPQVGPQHDHARETLDAVRAEPHRGKHEDRGSQRGGVLRSRRNYARIGNMAEAEKCFQQALHLDPVARPSPRILETGRRGAKECRGGAVIFRFTEDAMPEPPPQLMALVGQLGLAAPAEIRKAEKHVRRLARDLPQFESVWIDALAQARLLTPFQAAQLNAGRGQSLRVGPYLLCQPLGDCPWIATYRARPVDSGEWCAWPLPTSATRRPRTCCRGFGAGRGGPSA